MNIDSNSRIVVVGTSGAGKSTLARDIAKTLSIRDVELDELHWLSNWTMEDPAKFREKVQNALTSPGGWAVHGNYSKVRDLTWGMATHVLWLDYSRPVVFWRVFKRSVVRLLKREKLWAGNRESFFMTFFTRDSIILWSIQSFQKNRDMYETLLSDPEHAKLKISRFRNPRETREFMAKLQSSRSRTV